MTAAGAPAAGRALRRAGPRFFSASRKGECNAVSKMLGGIKTSMVRTRSQVRKRHRESLNAHTSYCHVGRRSHKSDPEAKDAACFLKQLWQLPRNTQHIPVPNPVSMLRADLPRLHDQPYFVSAKLDGVRFLLLMGMTEDGKTDFAYMIDRAYQMYKVDVGVAKERQAYMMGTLIDGELLQDAEGRLHFVGFDVVAAQGVDCTSCRYEVRMRKLRELMGQLRVAGCASCSAKRCLPMGRIRDLIRDMEVSEYPSDGLIFMPDRCPVRTGMHPEMFKWKTHHTIDFQLAEESGRPVLMYSCADGLHRCSELNIELVEDAALRDLRSQIPCIVECSCVYASERRVRAHILSSRPDKTCPNYERTVVLTLQNIREAIDRDELVREIEEAERRHS